uniref:Large ribosomal subunit protein bL21c n=1 Tax=Mesotaenium endlicherianum TaxID=184485 RepID=A0A024B4C7_9VIRI|nr:ribosomal protein L21 [Mesotaenium endlicherianum]AHZ11217.1 ribosomal protein L21 [Mesotaenium endlicherianum]
MNTYAIVEAGGEQIRVEAGRFYDVRHLSTSSSSSWAQNTKVLLYRVLMVQHQTNTLIGRPWVQDATVRGRILHPHRSPKVLVYKMRPKKKYRRKSGHRQNIARLVIDAICIKGQRLPNH